CVGKDLPVSKTAATTFTRTFHWAITKDVDKPHVNIADGGTATFNYTVSVTHDAGTDSAWMATGAITISNPNDWEAITANVSDAVDNGGLCTVSGGTNVSIPASGSVTLPFTSSYGPAPSPADGANTPPARRDK